MLGRADRRKIAAAIGALQALGGCAGGPDDREIGVVDERLNESAWVVADVGDFNADGLDDVLWDDAGKSQMAVWLMSGTQVLFAGAPIPGPGPGVEWTAAWAADFNADGMNDARWYNSTTNESAIWLMNATKLRLPGPTFAGPVGAGWTRVTSTDFSRDGMADLLWRDSLNGDAEVWLMASTHPILQGPRIPAPTGNGWVATTTGDFNADGTKDIVWYNPVKRLMSIALMAATARLVQGPEIPTPGGPGVWGPVSAADFNGDGMADVVWYNATTQRMAVWLMRGTALLAAGPEIPAPPGGGWSAVTTGDFNGDGMADVIWENLVGHQFAIWLMGGTAPLVVGPALPMPGGP
jgi:hypothetical protein